MDPLVMENVIGDILDPFNQSMRLTVMYQNRRVVNGCDLKPSVVANSPSLEIGGDDLREFFTLILVDPDSPSPSNPTLREYLHWMVTDIPGTTEVRFGREQVCYESPQPRSGIHRLVFLLFRQLGRNTVYPPQMRQNFNTRYFTRQHYLNPVAAAYFNCQREAGCGGRRLRR